MQRSSPEDDVKIQKKRFFWKLRSKKSNFQTSKFLLGLWEYKNDAENTDCVVSATFAEEEVDGKKLYDTLSKETFSYGSSSDLTYVGTVPEAPTLSPTQDTSDKTIGKYSFIITFKWGSFCNNENPAVYASKQTDVESWTADKKNMYAQALDKVYGVNGAKFKLTITTSSASATTGS